MAPIRLLIDTDVGNDIDDAFALAYAMKNPAFHVHGVTTVGQGGELRARIVRALADALEVDVPILIGAEAIGGEHASHVDRPSQLTWARDHLPPFETDPAKGKDVIDFIYEVAKARPGEVYLVTLGPLTNIARALARYPELVDLFAGIYIMGGETKLFRREHNIANDYIAADYVLRHGLRVHLATWSVGVRVTLDGDDLKRLEQGSSPISGLLARLWQAWNPRGTPYLYDVVPLAWLEQRDLVTSEALPLRVETTGLYTRGVTVDVRRWEGGLDLAYCTVPDLTLQEVPPVHVSIDADVDQIRTLVRETLIR